MSKTSSQDGTSEIVEIDFEVGHTSTIRSEATTTHNPPRTHDWKIFLRSADVKGDLSCLIQRCVFHLHHEFSNSKRELKSTPFAIQETGYAGFHLPIEIFFKTKRDPKKFLIEYNLDLHQSINGHPYRQKESYLRKYRCSFYNPDSDFRQKILAAGGKIVDSGPVASNDTDTDESITNEEPISRHSPQQKRPISPTPTANVVHKKIKLDQSSNNIIKKPTSSVIKNENTTKTTMANKKPKLMTHKSSSVVGETTSKNVAMRDVNQTGMINEIIDSSRISKPRSSTKLIKSQSTNDIKPSSQSTIINTKKKESVLSPSKIKTIPNAQTALKKSINKIPPKSSSQIEPKSTPIVPSPSNVIIKQEPFSQPTLSSNIPSNNMTPSVSINTLKKIPKKPISSSELEKRSRSSMPSSSVNRKLTTKNLQRQQSLSSKTQINLKRNCSLSSVNNSNDSSRSRKTDIIKDSPDHPIHQPSNSSKHEQSNHRASSPHKSTNSQKRQTLTSSSKDSRSTPSQSHPDLPINWIPSNDTSQPSTNSSSFIHILQNKDDHMSAPMEIDRQNDEDIIQFSDKSTSPHEQILVQSDKITTHRLSSSDLSDTNDSNESIDDNNEDEDLPTSLTNDDLRYKLIYIYKRFQLNSINDLIIFVRFFKRHHLIDISTLSLPKKADEMFTYDLFLLSPSHIGELANDLGYTTATNKVNSMKQ